VTARQPPRNCAAAVIDHGRLQRQGAMALRRTRDGFAVDAVKPRGLDRPWSPAGADDPEAELVVRPKPNVPHDATPAEADMQADD
jgi:competence protein ComEC